VEKPYGLLVAGMNFASVDEGEFNAWYDTEHVPERLRVDGFINAQRWLGVEDARDSIVTYDLKSKDVLKGAAYTAIAGANLSPWSKHVTGQVRRICRVEGEQTLPGRQAAPDNAGGLLMNAMNVAPEAEAEFNAWYNEEHIPGLLQVKGCIAARRFVATESVLKYVALYHLTAPEVQVSAAWKQAVDTPWTKKMRPFFRDGLRVVLRPYVKKS